MRPFHKALLAGFAGLSLVGSAAFAASKVEAMHEMTVQLPGGGVEQIRYAGNVPPRVVIGSAPFETAWAPITFGFDPSFARLEQISAAMDRRMEQLFRQSLAQTRWLDQQTINTSTLRNLPAGTSRYTWIATSNGNGYCTQTVQITAPANGGKPQVVSNKSGDCSAISGNAAPTVAEPSANNDVTPVKLKVLPRSSARMSL